MIWRAEMFETAYFMLIISPVICLSYLRQYDRTISLMKICDKNSYQSNIGVCTARRFFFFKEKEKKTKPLKMDVLISSR